MIVFLCVNSVKFRKRLTLTNLRCLTFWDGESIFFEQGMIPKDLEHSLIVGDTYCRKGLNKIEESKQVPTFCT
jgi:hypothetical protein